ncbi:MAG: acyl-CoA thioesterase [Oscillospiraceae bacterium]|jgi:acyl-CoA thioester hydrolase|nr:acyl-CoA thioesterase [Oscillospiraceae bacterium]
MKIQPYLRKAQFYETDQMGIIHHSNYIRWFEEARVDFMEQTGYGYRQTVDSGYDLVLLSVSCEYKSMVRFSDTVRIQARITELSPLRMTVDYTVTDADTGKLRATGHTKHCCFDSRAQRPASLKKAQPELYALFESIAVENDGQ